MKKRILAIFLSVCLAVEAGNIPSYAAELSNEYYEGEAVLEEIMPEDEEEIEEEIEEDDQNAEEPGLGDGDEEVVAGEDQDDNEEDAADEGDESESEDGTENSDKENNDSENADIKEAVVGDQDSINQLVGETVNSDSETVLEGLKYTSDETGITIVGYTDNSATELVIPDEIDSMKVIGIASEAFKNCYNLETITLPESLTSIAYGAFSGCSGLIEISIPQNVSGIGYRAFYNCSSLASVELPDREEGITMLEGQWASETGRIFEGCTSLETVKIPQKWTSIPRGMFAGSSITTMDMSGCTGLCSISNNAFAGCKAMETITLPESLTCIEYHAFSGCSGLKEISIPQNVSGIGYRAFYNCSSLANVELPDREEGITMLEGQWTGETGRIFEGCTSLETVKVPQKWTSIPGSMFVNSSLKTMDLSGCTNICRIPENAFSGSSVLETITLPESLTSIEYYAFSDCSGLKEIKIPESVSGIGYRAFYKCSSLTSVELPDREEAITMLEGQWTGEIGKIFEGCTSLETVKIPQKWTSIPQDMFAGSSINTMDMSACTNLSSISSNAFANCGSIKTMVLPESLTNIAHDAFAGSSIETITLPEGLKNIEYCAFSGCSGLKEIKIPTGVIGIGYHAFYNCKNLTSVELPDREEAITMLAGKWSSDVGRIFEGCTSLENVKIPQKWTSIPGSMFVNSSLKTMDLSGCTNIKSIPDYAFSGCSAMETVTLPEGLTSIEYNAFSGCSGLKEIKIPESVTGIGFQAFYNCSSLASVELPDREEAITMLAGKWASDTGRIFEGCTSLETVEIPQKWTSIPASMFVNSSLKTMDLSNCTSISSIPDNAFSGSSVLEMITLPEGLKSIEYNAFLGCKGLKKIKIPESVSGIGYHAFCNCSSLTSVELPDREEAITMLEGKWASDIGRIFEGCTSLETVKIPQKWTNIPQGMFAGSLIKTIDLSGCTDLSSVSNNAFSGCSAMETVTLPDGLTSIEYNAFFGCSVLKEIKIPESVTGIGYHAFYNCSSLTNVELPDREEAITMLQGKWSSDIGRIFEGCTSLETVEIPQKWTSIPAQIFYKCSNLKKINAGDNISNVDSTAFTETSDQLTVYLKRKSPSIVPFMEAGCSIVCQGEYSYPYSVLDAQGNSFTLNKSRIEQGIPCLFRVNYTCDTEKYNEISNVKVCIYIPSSMDYSADIVYLNGEKLDSDACSFDEKTRRLTVPVNEPSGEIMFSLVAKGDGNIQSYAQLRFTKDDTEMSQVIDCLMLELPSLSLECSDQTANSGLYLWGVTKSGNCVNIYCDDQFVGTLTANKVGKFETTITLPGEGRHVIRAEYKDDPSVFTTKTVLYKKESLSVTQFTFYYQQHEGVWLSKDLLGDPGEVLLTINPHYELLFKIDFSDSSAVEDVYVVSTKNGVKKYLKAERMSDGQFVAQGYFDPYDYKYVPGQISINYKLSEEKRDEVSSDSSMDDDSKRQIVCDNIFDMSAGQIDLRNVTAQNVTSETDGNITRTSGDIDFGDGKTVRVSSIVTKYSPEDTKIIEKNPSGYFTSSSYRTATVNGRPGYYSYDTATDTMQALVYDVASECYQSIYTTFGWISIHPDFGVLGYISAAMSGIEALVTLQNPNATAEQRADAIAALVVATGSVLVGLTGNPFLALAYNLVMIKGQDAISDLIMKFIMDPSGYVYEVIVENRLQGVKTTLYYKQHLEDEEALLWNAGDYGQNNPLYTNDFGEYAWDVPEGYWQVKYEKEGYETAYSEWLAVPPVQTEVNIGLITASAPVVDSVYSDGAAVTILFNQYMNVSDMNNISIEDASGKEYGYQVKESGLSKNVTLILDEKMDDGISDFDISIPESVTNYAGISMGSVYSKTVPVKKIPQIVAASQISLGYEKGKSIGIEIRNFSEGTKCELTNSCELGVEAGLSEMGSDGKAILSLTGKLPGNYTIILALQGTPVKKEIKVSVGDVFDEEPIEHTHSIKKVEAVKSTCIKCGMTEHYKCEVCNAIFSDQEGKVEISVEAVTLPIDSTNHLDKDKDMICDWCDSPLYEDGIWIQDVEDQIYTGKAIKPEIVVYDRESRLVCNRDYTLSITNNVNVGQAKVTIRGKGNYDSVEICNFNIVARDISGEDFASDDIAVKATGKEQKPKPVLSWKGKAVSASGYTYAYFEADESGNPVGTALTSVKEAGDYIIVLTGIHNFMGTRNVKLTVTGDRKLVSKLTVTKIADRQFTGKEIEPDVIVKDGKNVLTKGEHYSVQYFNNTKVGTASVMITGIGDYVGSKRVNFKITGIPISKATVEGIMNPVTYNGNDITFDNLKLFIKATRKAPQIDLAEGVDYKVSYLNNQKAGKATVVFTGINGYTGVLKKTFKIVAFKRTDDVENKINVELASDTVAYSKGGAKPEVTVTFTNADGSERTLVEKMDYTLTFANNTAVNDGSNPNKLPTVNVKLKGNYVGSISKNFVITPKDLSVTKASASDKTFSGKPNIFKSAVTVYDTDGKKLTAGKDYDSAVTYTYADGSKIEKTDIIPAGTTIRATVTAKKGSNYTGFVTCEYRITKALIGSTKASIPVQVYTGKPIEVEASDITVKVGKRELIPNEEYEIVPGSYTNNIKKGVATVTIRGIGNYGGTKKVNFKIKSKGFMWWWRTK